MCEFAHPPSERLVLGCAGGVHMRRVAWLGLFVPSLASAVPLVLQHQGRLLDAQGAPVDGTLTLTTSLFSTASGGSAIWTEANPGVVLQDGYYAVALGDTTPIQPYMLASNALWIEVATPTTLTRVPLGSAPWAARAAMSDGVQLAPVSETCNSANMGRLRMTSDGNLQVCNSFGWRTMVDGRGPGLWYNFQAGSTADLGSGGNAGTAFGSPTTTAGMVGDAMLFSGNGQYVTVGTPFPTNLRSQALTLVAWVKPAAYSNPLSADLGGIIASQWDGDTSGISMSLEYRTAGAHGGPLGSVHFQVGGAGGTYWAQTTYGNSTTALALNTWTHVVCVAEAGKQYKIYLNGVLAHDWLPAASIDISNNGSLRIGHNLASGSSNRYFNGAIDEPRLYTRALTAEDVAALYAMGAP